MSEIADASPPARFRRSSPVLPHVDWRPRLRWFAAEFLVVVSGVLVALLLNAWWADRHDRAEEAAALYHILRDLDTDLADLRGNLAAAEEARDAAAWLHGHPDARGLAPDSVGAALRLLLETRSFIRNTSEYASLTQGGRLGIISDPDSDGPSPGCTSGTATSTTSTGAASK